MNSEDYGLEWVSHLMDGDGKFIAKQEMASVGERPHHWFRQTGIHRETNVQCKP